MGKLIFFFIIIGIIYFFFKKSEIVKPKENNPAKEDDNEFVQCDKCKTFVLKKDTVKKDGKYICKDCYANT